MAAELYRGGHLLEQKLNLFVKVITKRIFAACAWQAPWLLGEFNSTLPWPRHEYDEAAGLHLVLKLPNVMSRLRRLRLNVVSKFDHILHAVACTCRTWTAYGLWNEKDMVMAFGVLLQCLRASLRWISCFLVLSQIKKSWGSFLFKKLN